MITFESIFSNKNVKRAFNSFSKKGNDYSKDDIQLKDIEEYWTTNKERILEELSNGNYEPGVVKEYEIVNGKGKKRKVTKMMTFDRFVTRLITQKLSDFYTPTFLEYSFAYQINKGVLQAAERARNLIEIGNEYVVEIDIKDFFDDIPIEKLLAKIAEKTHDEKVLSLIKKFLYCSVSFDGHLRKKQKGVLQGSSMSPVLSNLYLHEFDLFLQENEWNWMRFADDIYVFVKEPEEGNKIYAEITTFLKDNLELDINKKKSGVFKAVEQSILGYEFKQHGSKVLMNKHVYQKKETFTEWHPSVAQKVNKEYHILKNGVLNKHDYALLFENADEKHHIPIETTEQLNVYNEVLFTSSLFTTLAKKKIRLGIFDRHGNVMGYFVPDSFVQDSKAVLQQASEYCDMPTRLNMARKMEIAAIHNIRANLKYYNSRTMTDLKESIDELTDKIKLMNESSSVENLLLLEAQSRQTYYQTFNVILNNTDFKFVKRSKQPPEDAINALISFGNTLLYNKFLQIIWKTPLDPRIGVFHAANKRHYSLNLDFADLFKPIIVDRIIFTLINRKQLSLEDFENKEDGAVYLNDKGKKLFIVTFEEKMKTKLKIKDEEITYFELMEREINSYKKYVMKKEEYKPYKYY